MINPNEIMKGSILCHEGRAKKVKAIGDYIAFESAKEWIGGSMIEGEPLSHIWLTGLGFDKIQEGDMAQPDIYRKTYCPVLVKTNFDIQSRGNDFRYFEGNINVELKYIHQLQGLYFYVTGEHLKVPKLPK